MYWPAALSAFSDVRKCCELHSCLFVIYLSLIWLLIMLNTVYLKWEAALAVCDDVHCEIQKWIIFRNWKRWTLSERAFVSQDITSLERTKRTDVESQRRIVGSLIIYSILIYIGGVLLLYFYFKPTLWRDRFLYSLPLIVFPLLWVSVLFAAYCVISAVLLCVVSRHNYQATRRVVPVLLVEVQWVTVGIFMVNFSKVVKSFILTAVVTGVPKHCRIL